MTNNFCINLKLIRKNADLTQAEFGERVGLSQGFVANLEKGRYKPTVEHVNRIANEFNVSREWLLGGDQPEISTDHAPEYSPEEKQILDAMRVDPIAREMFAEYLKLPKSRRVHHYSKVLHDREELDDGSENEE